MLEVALEYNTATVHRKIQLRDGALRVTSPGLYFIYAQINYLDTNDVNAFQIVVNDSAWLLCTTMTHTPGPVTKANTCYTGGVRHVTRDTAETRDTWRVAGALPGGRGPRAGAQHGGG